MIPLFAVGSNSSVVQKRLRMKKYFGTAFAAVLAGGRCGATVATAVGALGDQRLNVPVDVDGEQGKHGRDDNFASGRFGER